MTFFYDWDSEMSQLKENYHHGDLRDSLIAATLDLVRKNGPEKFSMADACKEAGVSKAAPYRHFDNREALLEAVIEHGFQQMHSGQIRMRAQGKSS